MFTAEQFRTKVAECAETIKNTDVPSEIRKIERSMESYNLSAQNEDWLADNFDKMIRSQDVLSEDEALGERLDSKAVAKIEEHVLRCLGAAVIMQWNTIPTKLQRDSVLARANTQKLRTPVPGPVRSPKWIPATRWTRFMRP